LLPLSSECSSAAARFGQAAANAINAIVDGGERRMCFGGKVAVLDCLCSVLTGAAFLGYKAAFARSPRVKSPLQTLQLNKAFGKRRLLRRVDAVPRLAAAKFKIRQTCRFARVGSD